MSTLFYQLFEHESSTYTYVIGDASTKEVAVIDPVKETLERDLQFLKEMNFKVKYVLETHVHADHITSASSLRSELGAKVGLSEGSKVDCADMLLKDGQELELGAYKVKALTTPGHTDSCMSYVFEGNVFTGDALLIRGCGRTDFQQGSPEKLFESVRTKLFALPDETRVYPAHDYKGKTSSSIGEEKNLNPRLKLSNSFEDFKAIMDNLNLAHPKKIKESLPANMKCGSL
ncbi:MAG TPA: Zn-dependent hydrolase [Bdellovibrionales bacterium]|nr:Zn-dependent hydrolase [Pseudobdellovibrionaceae bacterium]HAG92304.1 Zn-dependent hydrolase [Bdellovibrionales bacterium]|tara:strand:+ start:834 stop:1526 length:693 start_codon:yes stop_codon:yes gene_type:complete